MGPGAGRRGAKEAGVTLDEAGGGRGWLLKRWRMEEEEGEEEEEEKEEEEEEEEEESPPPPSWPGSESDEVV